MLGKIPVVAIAVLFMVLAVSSTVLAGSDSDGVDDVLIGDAFGSMYDPDTGTVELDGDVVLAGTVVVDSGTLCIRGTGTITCSSVSGHLFSVSNGASLVIGGDDGDCVNIRGGDAQRYHSAIRVSGEGSVLTLTAGTTVSGFVNNNTSNVTEAKGNGGAVSAVGGSTVNIQGATLSGNTGYRGGSVFVKDSALNMTSGLICSSKGVMGGGIYTNHSVVKIEGGVIGGSSYYKGLMGASASGYDPGLLPSVQGNNADSGGGIFIAYESDLTVSGDAHIVFNMAFKAGLGKVYGGGVYANRDSKIHIEENGAVDANVVLCGTNIEPNMQDGAYGGGVFIDDASLVMTGGSVSNNMAVGLNAQGGGVRMLNAESVMTMSGGTVSENSSSVNGGGISIYDGTLNVSGDASITRNTAGLRTYGGIVGDVHTVVDNDHREHTTNMNIGSGPGIYAFGLNNKTSKVTISGGSVSNNTGSSDGKDICMAHKSKLEIDGGTVESVFIFNSGSGSPTVGIGGGYEGGIEFSGGSQTSLSVYSDPVTVIAGQDAEGTNTINYSASQNRVDCTVVAETFTVTFLPGNHGISSKQIFWNLVSGSPMPVAVMDGEPGYSFEGWDIQPSDTVTESKVFTAVWSQDSYEVVYRPGDHGTFSDEVHPDLVYGDDTPATAVDTVADTDEGYLFAGWSPSVTAKVTGNVEYVAQWTPIDYSVTYAYDGSEPSDAPTAPTGQTGCHVGDAIIPDVPSLNGYTLVWSSEQVAIVGNGQFTMPAENVTVTGAWTQDRYTVTYESGNHGSFADDVHSDLVYGDDTPATAVDPDADADAGYIFAGWSPSVATKVTGTAVYTATWTQILYTVTLVGDGFSVQAGGAEITGASVVHAGDIITITVGSGYTVDVGGLTTNGDGTYTVKGDVTVTSTYHATSSGGSSNHLVPVLPNVTVTYDTSVGSVPSSSTMAAGGTVVLPGAPSAEGYTFDGWVVDGEIMAPGESVVVSKDTTISAAWTGSDAGDVADDAPVGSSQTFDVGDAAKYTVALLLVLGGFYIIRREMI